MRLPLILAAALLAGCGPTPGDEALAEMEVSMRAQTDMVQRGVGLHEIFQTCTDDCSGHRAGYLWALDHADAIDDSYCVGPSRSFVEGCEMGVRAAAFE